MNKRITQQTNNTQAPIPFTARQIRQNVDFQHKKFTPASRNSRIQSWHQRMQGLFARQSY